MDNKFQLAGKAPDELERRPKLAAAIKAARKLSRSSSQSSTGSLVMCISFPG